MICSSLLLLGASSNIAKSDHVLELVGEDKSREVATWRPSNFILLSLISRADCLTLATVSRPEPLAGLGEGHALLNLHGHLGICLDLLGHERQCLLGESPREDDDPVHIANEIIPGIDDNVLPIVADSDRLIDCDDFQQRTGRRGTHISCKDLLPKLSVSTASFSLWATITRSAWQEDVVGYSQGSSALFALVGRGSGHQ